MNEFKNTILFDYAQIVDNCKLIIFGVKAKGKSFIDFFYNIEKGSENIDYRQF